MCGGAQSKVSDLESHQSLGCRHPKFSEGVS